MKAQAISNQSFEAKRLRLVVKKLDLTNPDLMQYGRQTKRVNLVKEYVNPRAEELYKKAMQTNNIKEKTKLFSQMGDYELYDFGDGFLGAFKMKIYLAISKITDRWFK